MYVNSFAQAQWQRILGPDWRDISSIAKDGQDLYAANATRTYLSTDEGYHWKEVGRVGNLWTQIGFIADRGRFFGNSGAE